LSVGSEKIGGNKRSRQCGGEQNTIHVIPFFEYGLEVQSAP
jgi:hypothetical protein